MQGSEGQQIDITGNANPGVLKQGAFDEKGEDARLSSFIGAIAVADLVKTTLGPKGMDKILMPMGNRNEKI
jgi:T-complex protein 1 subunit beta